MITDFACEMYVQRSFCIISHYFIHRPMALSKNRKKLKKWVLIHLHLRQC